MPGENRKEMGRAVAAVVAFYGNGVREFEHNLVRAATSREGKAPGSPVDSGENRGSLRITLGRPSTEQPKERSFYPVPGAAEVDAALKDFEIGEVVWNAWIARHANILEGGRRASSRGWMIGSDQAPDGFLHLARDEALSKLDRWKQ